MQRQPLRQAQRERGVGGDDGAAEQRADLGREIERVHHLVAMTRAPGVGRGGRSTFACPFAGRHPQDSQQLRDACMGDMPFQPPGGRGVGRKEK